MTSVDDRPAKVVVLRAAEQAGPLLQALSAAGLEPLLLPLIEVVEPADGGAALAASLRELDRFDWLVFTSPNAVRAVDAARSVLPNTALPNTALPNTALPNTALPNTALPNTALPNTALPNTVAIAAVGSTTATLARRLFGRVDFVPSEANARTLAAELPLFESGRGESIDAVLAPLAALASTDLADGLVARGANPVTPIAYRTVVPELPDERVSEAARADAVLFTSGSTVDRFVAAVGIDRLPARRIAIGPRTAEHMQAAGISVTEVAAEATHDGLVAALLRSLRP